MITYPIAKVNLGLLVTEKRADGFHNIESVFYPVPIQDALEVVESSEFKIDITGIDLDENAEDNLVVKAYLLLKEKYKLPPVHIHLHKNIPIGAGLGGGSADASYMLKLLNEMFQLDISEEQLMMYALQLGSDCPFFINPRPVFVRKRGELIEDFSLNLSGKYLVIVKPPVPISTAEAYKQINPSKSRISLKALLHFPISKWRGNVQNQFESYAFSAYPEICEIKQKLYDLDAIFALMSGSGSAVYGIFSFNVSNMEAHFPVDYKIFKQRLY